MTLRIQPARWQRLLLASAGLLPFGGCGGATEADQIRDGGGGTTSHAGATNTAGKAAGGALNVAGTGQMVNVAGTGATTSAAGAAASPNTAGAGSAGPAFNNPFPCLQPTPAGKVGSGYEVCQGGYVRRVGPANCVAGGNCTLDSQCTEGSVCACAVNGLGYCTGATCNSGGDCLLGFDCTAEVGPVCGATATFACQVPGDACASASQCPTCMSCIVVARKPRECQSCCVVGRPFLVAGVARQSAPRVRLDWIAPSLMPDCTDLEPAVREQLAEHWRNAALMEHASIAAFSRFVLELLALAAPPDLIEDASRAMLDEAAHAKACFALASAYAGAPWGPSALPVADSIGRTTLLEVALTGVLEGCVGESVAALEAAEALERATDPTVRGVLGQILKDELRHAALAYRFVRWAIEQGGAPVRSQVDAVFADALEQHGRSDRPAPALEDNPELLSAHGWLTLAERHELRGQVLSELIAPTMARLLAA